MRVCFGTLCFSSRLNTACAEDEDAQQVVVATDRGGGGPALLNGGPESHGGTGRREPGRFFNMEGGDGGNEGTSTLPVTEREELLRLLVKKDEEIKRLQDELAQSHHKIFELRSQLDKFQSVMAITHNHPASPKGLGSQLRPRKQRAGISAEPQNEKSILEMSSLTFPTIYKNESSRELIKAAILDNDFMKNLEITQIREIVDCMYPEEYLKGSIIIQEGDVGSIVYVLEGNEMQVLKEYMKRSAKT